MKKKTRPHIAGTKLGDTPDLAPAPSEAGPSIPCRRAPWWVKVFVPFHILAITSYTLPLVPASHLVNGKPPGAWYQNTDWLLFKNENDIKVFPPIYAYLMATGFWQYWDMFAPDPVQGDMYGSATIFYRDGTKRDYQYPRMFLLPIPQKYLDERYRKFFERVHDYTNFNMANPKPYVAERFAQRIALLNDDNPANPPVEVKLYTHEWDIPKFGRPIHPTYNNNEYFDYIVEQDQLAKDKADER